MSRVAIVHLPSAAGHFLVYAQCFVEAARQRYSAVYVLVPAVEPAQGFASLCEAGVRLITYTSGLPQWRNAPLGYVKFSNWLGVRRASRQLARSLHESVHLILTFIDMFPLAFALFGVPREVTRVFALSMRADVGQHGPASGARAWFKHRLWSTLSQRFPGVLASNDPCLIERLPSQADAVLLEDFSFCHGMAPMAALDPQLRCLAIGYLDVRKNLSKLLTAVLICRHDRNLPIHLTLAGEFIEGQLDESGRQAMAQLRAEQALTELSGHIADDAYRAALARAHVVWAVYRQHDFASGVVIDAIAAGRGLMAQSTGVIGYYARRYSLALTQPSDASPQAIADSFVQMRDRLRDHLLEAGTRAAVAPSEPQPLDRSQYVARIYGAMVQMV
jgi:hypothetical protein